MKSLREYQISSAAAPHSTEPVTWGRDMTHPILGTVNGLPVTAITPVNIPDASPGFLCEDNSGAFALVALTDFIGAPNNAYLPSQLEGTTTGQTPLVGSTR
jgi:hypothetical protein